MNPRILTVLFLIVLRGSALAWWDTFLTTSRPVPLVKEIEAESCTKAEVVNDEQANGGRGGQAVLLQPGGTGLTTEVEVQPGVYEVFVIARNPDGKAGHDLISLDLKEHATGQSRSWTMVCAYRESYHAVGQLYFPAHAGGRYTLTVKLATKLARKPADPAFAELVDGATLTLKEKTLVPLLVDRLELRDPLGNCARKAGKTKRMLTSDEEIAKLRGETTGQISSNGVLFPLGPRDSLRVKKDKPPEWWANGRSAADRKARNDELWAKVPDWNEHIFNVGTTPWAELIGRDHNGLIMDASLAFEKTGHAEFGWDGAVTLCALAEKFPALDYYAQAAMKGSNLRADPPFTFTMPAGKSVYRGWAGGDMERLARSYDRLFDFIQGNQALAEYVGTKIPWVKTPQDVIKLLDVHLLQHGLDACARDVISGGDSPKALIPLVQGVNDISRAMLDRGIFTKIAMDMTFRGGIDDQAVCGYSRDGVHYIGSVGYLSKDLQEIAEILHRYRLAGGDARYDLLDPKRYPQMLESDKTVAQTRVSGFRLLQGDAGDLRLARDSEYKPAPARVLGGFGVSALETGQFGNDPLAMRGVGLTFGIGRGHAHQDTLNIELFAHGCRVAPDLGGRHEGKLHGSPNMRWNKVHNLVEVDGRNFMNEYAGSTTAATGWNTSFAPLPGAQFMEHHARATSHTNVSLYARQTALVDVGTEDSYVFDVFRVRGGTTHTYCFHGGPTENLAVNTPLTASKDQYLRKHFEGTQQEGATPAMLQADWVLRTNLQKGYQGDKFQADRPVTTRLALFGREGDKTMVGNAFSEAYSYNFPFLYVQGRQDAEGRESVFPAIIEPFAGKPFITEKRLVAVTPAQKGADTAVALEVKTTAGTTDLLYASEKPVEATTLDGKVKVTGRFALLSRDGDGVRVAHLVGGTELIADDIMIKAERGSYEARVTGVNYDARAFTVDQPLPARLLRGAVVGLGSGPLRHAFQISDINGKTVTHEKTARYFQSTILSSDDKAGTVECEIEPAVFGCDTEFVDGTTVSNEKQDKFWKTTLQEADRWMNVGYPGHRTSFPNSISWDDIPDTNGDGRRTLKMLGRADEKDDQTNSLAGQVILEIDATRLTDNGETFYFNLPSNEKYQRGGWQYAYRPLVNEAGKTVLQAYYPGSSFLWKLDGGFGKSDFTDANRDGKTKLCAYLFGPGDTMQTDTFVQVRRESPGVYEVRANVPCTVSFGRKEFKLTEKELADGRAMIRLEK